LISGDANTALGATPDIEYARIGRSLTGQYLATRALALATLNRRAEALETAERARAGTTSLEAHNLAAWASVAATSVSSQAVSDLVLYALHCSFVRGDRSSFVTAYRAIPNLLEHAVSARNYREPLRLLLTNLGERDLAKIHDIELLATPVRTPRHSDLSRRESEVAELLLQGLTNRQIASTLFISEVTVKAHLRHIYAKLNVRSRTEAALSLMRRLDPPQGRARTAS
jgi:DNA-binding NarL/FixJ family response regulator